MLADSEVKGSDSVRAASDGLLSWLAGRKANCLRIADLKAGADRRGWLDDAANYQNVISRISTLTEALVRNRQGYLNILEMRQLSGEQWGQRDGYGGRYGALTREEIESVITGVDEALAAFTREVEHGAEVKA